MKSKSTVWLMIAVFLGMLSSVPAQAFDHTHQAWDDLARAHIRWIGDGNASRVDYGAFQRQRLQAYLASLSAVTPIQFETWSREQRLAFLINAYNAFTIELILTRYPDLDSIKDLGSLFSSPWKKKYFTLLGEKRHLDGIEHGLIRAPGVYDEPRIHFAVVCAAIGCPGIRNEAFTAEKIDDQLDDSLLRFLSDRRRNRYQAQSDTLEVSKIFKWYRGDFEATHGSIEALFARYADRLTDSPAHRDRVRRQRSGIDYLDYDWKLNDLARSPR